MKLPDKITPRKLLATAALVTVALSCADVDAAQAPPRLAVAAYTFRNFTLLEAIEKSRELGVKFIEPFAWEKIGGEFKTAQFNGDAPAGALELVKARMEDAGLKFSGYYSQFIGKDEPASRKVFEFCRRMGIPIIVGEPPPGSFDMVEKLANEYGVNIAVHNHPGPSDKSLFWDPANVLKEISGRGERIGACPDTGHWYRSGLDPVACLAKYKGRIFSMHMKDIPEARKEAHDVPWGEGKSNLRAQIEELKRQNFRGFVSIEYERNPADPMPDAKKCVAFFNATIRAVYGADER
jgi:sugar phosphate isomerase/epimerase